VGGCVRTQPPVHQILPLPERTQWYFNEPPQWSIPGGESVRPSARLESCRKGPVHDRDLDPPIPDRRSDGQIVSPHGHLAIRAIQHSVIQRAYLATTSNLGLFEFWWIGINASLKLTSFTNICGFCCFTKIQLKYSKTKHLGF